VASESIDKLAKTLAETLPQGLRSVRDDLEKNFRSVLQSGLGKLDLVTREEFEVQEAVLARTRQKLEALESRLEKMESGPTAKKIRKKAAKKTTKKSAKKKSKR
jgi:BMFP domain-containing protein YqiC